MSGWAGWEVQELPAGKFARELAGVVLPPSRAERDMRREEAKDASARAAGNGMEEAGFIARMNGHALRDPLAEAAAGSFGRDRGALDDRKRAIEALRPLGLAHVVTGGQSGCILDANMGILEPAPDSAQRAEMDRQYQFERSQREADERTRYIGAVAAQLNERLRSRGLGRGVSSRSVVQRADDAERRRYEMACAEIGQRPVSYR